MLLIRRFVVCFGSAGLILTAIISADLAADPVAHASTADLGVLTPFYRSTQVQGHIEGSRFLMAIPEFLESSEVDVRYNHKPGFKQEIPFVDRFSINRFVGGYRKDWLEQYGYCVQRECPKDYDYAYKKPDRTLGFNSDLVAWHLKSYLVAGYKLSDITVSIENIPWDLARGGGDSGAWGQRNPPFSMEEWRDVVLNLARDIAKISPPDVPQGFKIGNEYDAKASFSGGRDDFFSFYTVTYRALREVFPRVQIVPGEFTGTGVCPVGRNLCVYDTKDLLEHSKRTADFPSYVPRSLHSILARSDSPPSEAVQRAVKSYARLGDVIPEIHQFGLLGQPFSSDHTFGNDQGARQAAWEFHTMLGLLETLRPRRVFHWDTFSRLEGTDVALLNGSGFVRLFLDRYLGAATYRLDVPEVPSPGVNVKAIAFRQHERVAVMISSFTAGTNEDPVDLTVRLPRSIFGSLHARDWRIIRYSDKDNVFSEVRRDLASVDNLKTEFVACLTCVAQPMAMARDRSKARTMLLANWPKYKSIMKAGLRWQAPQDVIASVTGDDLNLQLRLAANELVVLEQELP